MSVEWASTYIMLKDWSTWALLTIEVHRCPLRHRGDYCPRTFLLFTRLGGASSSSELTQNGTQNFVERRGPLALDYLALALCPFYLHSTPEIVPWRFHKALFQLDKSKFSLCKNVNMIFKIFLYLLALSKGGHSYIASTLYFVGFMTHSTRSCGIYVRICHYFFL